MTLEQLGGERVAVVMFIEKAGQEDEIVWFASEPRQEEQYLVFERSGKPPFKLPIELLEDVRTCSQAQRGAFEGCKFVLPLTIKELPPEGNVDDLEFTGLNVND